MPQILNADGTSHKLCPMRAFENYIGNLNPKNRSLWQRPPAKFPTIIGKPWYDNIKVGHNTHEKFMSNICDKVKMSARYTNHCIRVTGVTNLRRSNFNAKQVMAVSGHKSVESLTIYEHVQEDEKLMMGMCLTYSLLCPEDAIMIQNSLEIDEPKIQPHLQQVKALPAPMPQPPILQQAPQENVLVPLQNAIVPYQQPQEIDETANFDLMSLIAEMENNEIPDEDMLLAATQCKLSLSENSLITPTTTTKTSLVKRSTVTTATPTFTGRHLNQLEQLIFTFISIKVIKKVQKYYAYLLVKASECLISVAKKKFQS